MTFFDVSTFRWMEATFFQRGCVEVCVCVNVVWFCVWGWGCVCKVSMRHVFSRTVCQIYDTWWGGGPIPWTADLKRFVEQSMLIKSMICIIYDVTHFLENGIPNAYGTWWGEGHILSPDWKRVSTKLCPNMLHNMQIKKLICIYFLMLFGVLLVFYVVWLLNQRVLYWAYYQLYINIYVDIKNVLTYQHNFHCINKRKQNKSRA